MLVLNLFSLSPHSPTRTTSTIQYSIGLIFTRALSSFLTFPLFDVRTNLHELEVIQSRSRLKHLYTAVDQG